MLCLFLVACTGPGRHIFSPLTDPNQAMFLKGLEELKTGDASPTLEELANRPEAGPWQFRARTLLHWQTRIRNEEQSKVLDLQNQLRGCRSSNDRLSQENGSLNHDLQELKRIMVEMERRSK